ncbi:glycosyltransferase [Paracoccus rhizosphaerae]|uniref:Glycosyltransferase n=1 Tax=Paracoccus rhizosphaerae TaxID=1133347 RepID=A0ABV6CNZ1_9RHOB|nr:glycosyltransferase [Paracoccus rhizosphaerae]
MTTAAPFQSRACVAIPGPLPEGALRIVMICPPFLSHLRAFEAIGKELLARGHQVIFLAEPDAEISANHVVHALPPDDAPRSERGFIRNIRAGAQRTDRLCRFGLSILRALSPDLILGDQTEPAAGLLADAMRVPMLSVACALPFDPEPGIPLPFVGWSYDPSDEGLRRNDGGEMVTNWLMTPHRRVILSWAARWGLGRRDSFADCLSRLGTLAQTVPGFDFPRPVNGAGLTQVGPFRRDPPGLFPADIRPDPGRPLVYVSLGTLQGHRWRLLACIAQACRNLGAQVIVSHGNALDPATADRIGANWVRSFVPQRAVLARADLCVTHGGLNTTLECLAQGVPMLAIPLAHDQPGVAARIERCGVGLRLGRMSRRQSQIEAALSRLLSEPVYAANARRMAAATAQLPGAAGVVQRIERLVGASPRGKDAARAV